MHARGATRFVTAIFAAILVAPGIWQLGHEFSAGKSAGVFQVFQCRPTVANLRAYESDLEASSRVMRTLRPWMQWVQFRALGDPGEKVVVGRSGWWFYRPGVEFLTARRSKSSPGHAGEPLEAIVQFRDALAQRGMRLVVVPVPNKESIYPEQLTSRAAGLAPVIGKETRGLLEGLRRAEVDVVDLFVAFAAAKHKETLYLQQDSHWSPAGVAVAARTIANHLCRAGCADTNGTYVARLQRVTRVGDLVRMLEASAIEAWLGPETVDCQQIVIAATGRRFTNDPTSAVLLLGDSFSRIFEYDEPGAAGLVAHLAQCLGEPVAALVSDGGASTLVRQELFRRPELLEQKRVVIWEFAERDLRLGSEGWQQVPLPPVRH